MSLTARICGRFVEAARAPMPPALRRAAAELFVDGIAVAVAGARIETAPGILADYFAEQGARPTATLLGLGARLPAVQAALVNAASMHVLDFEPMWLPSTHALSPALAAALALGEAQGAAGAKILTAMILGIEIQGWLRQAAGPLESHELAFHPPGFVGPIGAAVAASHLLDFDAVQMANAIGIAASRCGGLFSNLGTMTKSSHSAYAAAQGLEAALLTARGFTGSLTIFDAGPQDYGHAFFPRGFEADLLLNAGAPWRILDPGYAIKIFPAKFSTHYAITAALAVRGRIPSLDVIRSIHITAADVPSSDRPHPRSGLDGKFSLQYTAAAALLDGHVGFAAFTDERLLAADMQALLGKISLTLTREIPSKYTSGRHLLLEVELTNGTRFTERCDQPRGSWGAAPIAPDELRAKATDCLATLLSPADAAACAAEAASIDSLDADAVRALLQRASGPACC